MSVFAGTRRAIRRVSPSAVVAGPEPVQKGCPKLEPEPQEGEGFAFAAFGVDEDDEDDTDLSLLTRDKLVELAEARGLTVPKRATKPQIVAMLEG